MNKKTQSIPLAYFITFTTYGTRIRGDQRETVDRFHNAFDTPYIKENNFINAAGKIKMSDDIYLLNHKRREIVLSSILTATKQLDCELYAAHVRSNHVHIVIYSKLPPTRLMTKIKAQASEALNINEPQLRQQKKWTRHGSTRFLWCSQFLVAAMRYVINEQGEKMSYFVGKQVDIE